MHPTKCGLKETIYTFILLATIPLKPHGIYLSILIFIKIIMNSTKKIGISVICIATSLYGLTLKIDNVGHYFGTGTVFGVGLSLLSSTLYKKYKSKNKEDKYER